MGTIDVDVHTGEHRQGVILAGGRNDLADGLHEELRVNGAGDLRQDRELGVIIQRNERQLETGGTTDQQNLVVFLRHLDFLVGQGSNDVREQLTGHGDASRLIHHASDTHAGGDFVVEAGEFQTIVIRGDQHGAQYRLGDLRGKAARDPRYGVGEVIFGNAK